MELNNRAAGDVLYINDIRVINTSNVEVRSISRIRANDILKVKWVIHQL